MSDAFHSRRRFQHQVVALAALVASGLAPLTAHAQAFPNKPVRLIVTYPPGGSSDLMARIVAQKLSEHWGQQVLVESKPGAAGSIGMEFTARQPADDELVRDAESEADSVRDVEYADDVRGEEPAHAVKDAAQ